MLIRDIQVNRYADHVHVQANIGAYPLWFRHNDLSADIGVDASVFLISALIPAMLLGEDVQVHEDYSVSEKLLISIEEIQTIIHQWNPIFKKINVQAVTHKVRNAGSGCAAFFSAGVDSLYTAIKHRDELNALILINGFDFNMDSQTWQDMVARNKELSRLLNKQLILVETNLKEFTSWFKLARYANFGASLATIANLFNFGKVHISGHETYEKINPAGAHPLLDPLWSTEGCSIRHTGLEADRTGKVAVIKHHPELLSRLWVCWKDPKVNCGKCSKCIRSFVALKLCGIDDFEFESPVRVSDIATLSIENDEVLLFFEYFQRDAQDKGMQQLAKALNKLIFKYKSRRFFLDLDKNLLHSNLKRLRNFNKPVQNDLADISIHPRHSDHIMLKTLLACHQDGAAIRSTADIGTVFK